MNWTGQFQDITELRARQDGAAVRRARRAAASARPLGRARRRVAAVAAVRLGNGSRGGSRFDRVLRSRTGSTGEAQRGAGLADLALPLQPAYDAVQARGIDLEFRGELGDGDARPFCDQPQHVLLALT